MHPLAITPSGHDAGIPQIRKVPGNLGLGLIQYFYEKANANFLISHQVQEPQPCIVSKRLKESLDIKGFLPRTHTSIIFVLTDVSTGNIVGFADMSEG